MRTFEEVGKISFSKEANEAYQVYASLYLDWIDDNMSHFRWRDIDISPITELEEAGKKVNDKSVRDAYLKEAFQIAEIPLSGGYFSSLENFFEEYPPLKEYEDKIEALFYEEK